MDHGASDRLRLLREEAERLMHAGVRGAEAIDVNVAILELDRDDIAVRTRLGYAYRQVWDFDSAEAIYGQILDRTPSGSQHHTIATRAIEKIAVERELYDPDRLAELVANVVNADDARTRASAARDAKRLELALRWSDRSLELAERQGRSHLKRSLATRASILRDVQRSEQAVEAATRCIELDPSYDDNGPAYRTLVAGLVDLGRFDEATDIVVRLLEPDRGNSYAQSTAARALRECGTDRDDIALLERSRRCSEQVLALEPTRSVAIEELRKLHAAHTRAGRTRHAAEIKTFLAHLGLAA